MLCTHSLACVNYSGAYSASSSPHITFVLPCTSKEMHITKALPRKNALAVSTDRERTYSKLTNLRSNQPVLFDVCDGPLNAHLITGAFERILTQAVPQRQRGHPEHIDRRGRRALFVGC